MAALCSLLLAFALDRWLGEPPVRWHPVVWMGRYLESAGQRIAPRTGESVRPAREFVLGLLAWAAGAALVLAVAVALQWALDRLPLWAAVLLGAVALKPLLAWRMLAQETAAVEAALTESLQSGREQLARLVSRDVARLDESGVRESAIESLAENLNDSVVAPVFWFVLFGLPGAALYRFANTADAMWGYRGERGGRVWEWAGKFAARCDDVLSWLPARLTALLIAAARRGVAWAPLRCEARRTASPNSGWPMAAMALALAVRLGKPGVYTLNAQARPPERADGLQAQALAARAVLWLLALAALALAWRPWSP
jgi:adenosylcobinamide-phosphate synthase